MVVLLPANERMTSMLRTRILTALILIPLVLLLMWFAGIYLTIALSIVIGLAYLEGRKLLELKEDSLLYLGLFFAALIPVIIYAGFELIYWLSLGILVLISWVVILAAKDLDHRGMTRETIGNTFLILYVGVFLSTTIFLRDAGGFYVLLAVLLTVWANDSGAYFVGRGIGGRKLVPNLSPGKTVSGAIGGLVFGSATFTITMYLIGYGFSFLWLVLGILLAFMAQIGDLFESLLKRQSGVKDSGTLLPGHGGILDRLDSLMVTLPAAYLCLKILEII